MKQLILFILALITFRTNAQHINATQLEQMRNAEDSMKPFANQMIFAPETSTRFYADSVFIRSLVKVLKNSNSFYYPFDSIKTVSKIYAPDSSFRIFTWQIEKDESYYRQYGAIQMRTADGSLKLFPLTDQSDFSATPTDGVRTNKNWIGAIYYGIIQKEFAGKQYYTLFGFDDNDLFSTRKWLEVLTFNEKNEPLFGGPYFEYENDTIKPDQPVSRFCLEFKKDARSRLVFDKELDLIIFDHLISESNELDKKFTLIPDGDYEGFKWANGKWQHVKKVFSEQPLLNGQFPMPVPLLDDNGNPKNQ
jgi:hypothetical protein